MVDKFYTTMPIEQLGDDIRMEAQIREAELISWDRGHFCIGVVDGVKSIVICSLIHQSDKGSAGLGITLNQLLQLPKSPKCSQPEIQVRMKRQVEQVQYAVYS